MDCKRLLEDLVAYLDGELNTKLNTQIKEHLNTCPACQKEARLYAKTWGMLDQVPQLTLNPQLIDNIKKSLRPTWLLSWARWYKVAGLTAAAGLIIALSFYFLPDAFKANTPETTLPTKSNQVDNNDSLLDYYTELLAEYEATKDDYININGNDLETLSPYLFVDNGDF